MSNDKLFRLKANLQDMKGFFKGEYSINIIRIVRETRNLVDYLANGHDLSQEEIAMWYKARNVCNAYDSLRWELEKEPQDHLERSR